MRMKYGSFILPKYKIFHFLLKPLDKFLIYAIIKKIKYGNPSGGGIKKERRQICWVGAQHLLKYMCTRHIHNNWIPSADAEESIPYFLPFCKGLFPIVYFGLFILKNSRRNVCKAAHPSGFIFTFIIR